MNEHGGPRERDVRILEVLLVDEKRSLTKEQARARYGLPERRFRAAISELRLRGVPLVAFSTEGSVYRLARTEAEATEFVEAELLSRARVLEQQARAIRDHLAERFGEAEQMSLIAIR